MSQVFVMGTGRCGTHTLQKVLGSVPNTLAIHEGAGELDGKQIDVGDMKALNVYAYYVDNTVLNRRDLWAKKGQARHIMNECFRGRDRLIEICERKGLTFVDVNRMGYNFVGYVAEKYPEAKFVHLVRDGYDCVRSWHRRLSAYNNWSIDAWLSPEAGRGDRRRLWKVVVHNLKRYRRSKREFLRDARVLLMHLAKRKLTSHEVELISRNNQFLFSAEKPRPPKDGSHHTDWVRAGRLRKLCWFWNYVNERITYQLSGLSDERHITVRIERMDEHRTHALLNTLGLEEEFDQGAIKKHDASHSASELWEDEANVRIFNSEAAERMEQLGYETRRT